MMLFDLGVMYLLICLLKTTGHHPGWVIAYGWCPLVIKECANSGHLDSIAIFLAVVSLLAA